MKNNFKKGFIVPLAIALVVIIAGGVYFYSGYKKGGNSTQVIVDNKTNSITDKSDWKTYTNSEYGFSFQYPKEINITENKELNTDSKSNKWLFITQENTAPVFGFEDSCGKSKAYINLIMDKDFTIGGVFENAQKIIDTVEYNYKTGGGSKVSDITSGNIRMAKFVGNPYGKSQLMFNGNKSIEFSTQKCAGGFIPFDEIVSTFKFINNGDSPTKSDDKSTSIKVLSPNGGEVWKIGNTYNISFAVNGNIGSRTVSLNRYSDDGVKVNSKVIGIVEVNSVVYKIPSDTVETRGDAGRYKIEVSSSDKYQDVSDNYFTIIN